MSRHTANDVARKVELINTRLIAAGREPLLVQSTNPDGMSRRYEFAGWVYIGAGEACRALDAMLWLLREIDVTATQREYISRAIDCARSDDKARQLLSPVERDELQKRFGGRQD